MVITLFLIDEKDKKFCFFKKDFLLANINIKVTFGIFFLTLNNIKVNFNDYKLK